MGCFQKPLGTVTVSGWREPAAPLHCPGAAPAQLQPHVPPGGEELDTAFPMYKATHVPPGQSLCAVRRTGSKNHHGAEDRAEDVGALAPSPQAELPIKHSHARGSQPLSGPVGLGAGRFGVLVFPSAGDSGAGCAWALRHHSPIVCGPRNHSPSQCGPCSPQH